MSSRNASVEPSAGVVPCSENFAMRSAGLRSADVVVVVLGDQYGVVQPGSGVCDSRGKSRGAREQAGDCFRSRCGQRIHGVLEYLGMPGADAGRIY